MKKFLAFLLAFIFIFSFIGCGENKPKEHTDEVQGSKDKNLFVSAPTPTPSEVANVTNDLPPEGTKVSGIIPEEISTLTGLTSLKNIGWSIQSGGKVSLLETGGNDGACVFF